MRDGSSSHSTRLEMRDDDCSMSSARRRVMQAVPSHRTPKPCRRAGAGRSVGLNFSKRGSLTYNTVRKRRVRP